MNKEEWAKLQAIQAERVMKHKNSAKKCNFCGGVFYRWKKVGNKFRPDCPKCEKVIALKRDNIKADYAVKRYSGEGTKYRKAINEDKIMEIMNGNNTGND